MSLIFDPQNPFPRVALENYDYAQAKLHSAKVDRWLGFEIDTVEAKIQRTLNSPEGHWHGLPAQTLLTPYVEIRMMLELCKPQVDQVIADLGCAYGRMGFVVDRLFPKVHFHGYEIEAARVREAHRVLKSLQNPNLEVFQWDLCNPKATLPLADVYFIYDFGTQKAIEQTLLQIQEQARRRPLTVIGRGRGTRHQIQTRHPWLCEVVPPVHTATFSVYFSN